MFRGRREMSRRHVAADQQFLRLRQVTTSQNRPKYRRRLGSRAQLSPIAGGTPIALPWGMTPEDFQTADEDRKLLVRLRAGDDAAYEELVRCHGGRLLAVARRLLRNEEDARDAVQDGMLSVFRSLESFRGDSRLTTWLHRIVVNAALMKLRSRRRAPETPIEPLLPVFDGKGRHTRDWHSPDVESALIDAERRAEVRRAIDCLPESYRTVLLLRDIEEISTGTVAGMLEVSPNAVKIRLHRARQALTTLVSRSSPRHVASSPPQLVGAPGGMFGASVGAAVQAG